MEKISPLYLLTFAALLWGSVPITAHAGDVTLRHARKIPVQHNGRVKSFDVFAREILHEISAKQSFQKEPAIHFLLKHLHRTEEFLDIAFIRVDYLELKELLGFPEDDKYFSYRQIKPHFSAIGSIVQRAQAKRDQDLRPTPLEQKAELLYSRLVTVDRLVAGELLRVIPSDSNEAWMTLTEAGSSSVISPFRELLAFYHADSYSDFDTQAQNWLALIQPQVESKILRRISLENLYYGIKPFQRSWMFYLLSFILLLIYSSSWGRGLGIAALAAGILFHTGGIVLRVLILSRPPVSNMYESMIFMNWVLILCACVYYFINRSDFILKAGALASALVMIYGDLLPISQSLDVLVPVLRSNYWLTIHVMTIVASYGVFGLAMAVGHRQLLFSATGRMTADDEQVSAHIIDRLIQAGVITLGIGTVLGGVWANESWGRFWGWDPKETWALITFLGYLVVIHLRAGGRMDHFWVALSAILGFLLVLMTWYGVNFLLGRGLHSYGSGSGGVQWIIYYLIVEVLFLGFIFTKRIRHV